MPVTSEKIPSPTQEIYFELGVGTRMRRLMEQLTADSDRLYEEKDISFRVSYFYAMYALVQHENLTIADIAKLAGFSHSAVSQTVKKLIKEGIVETIPTEDGRQKMVCFTDYGKIIRGKLLPIWAALERSMKDVMAESGYNLVDCITAMEARLKKRSLYDRVQTYMTNGKTPGNLEIIPYHTDYKQAYYDLNVDWMDTTTWDFDTKDLALLANPEHHILDKGGEIFFAIKAGAVVGTVTMKQAGAGRFELEKLIVSDKARGHGAGAQLCHTLIDRFKARGGQKLFLETNATLTPAIELYKRVGFIEMPITQSPHDCTDYYMEWKPHDCHN